MADNWGTIHAERRALAADLEGLDDVTWATPSLAEGWSVRDVVAHMTATARMSPLKFFPKFMANGFSFDKMQAKDIATEKGGSPAQTLANFKSIVDGRGHPPGPPATLLGEVLVHSEDIRRALGIAHPYPIEAAVTVADFYKGSNLLIGTKTRITGISLRATDTSWTTGSGPEAAGPIMSVLLAMTGRKAALADLSGEGVEVLSGR